jgi:L-idonate 5-dehydrogenase
MSDAMLGYLLHGAEDLRRADLPRPVPGEGEVLLRVRRAGICGSDIHYFTHGRVGRFVPKHPLVLGHEFAGDVAELGSGLDSTLLGARVAVDPSMPCGRCRHCRTGRYNLCLDMRFFGSASCDPHLNGGFAEFVAVSAANCHRLPETVSWGEAALVEPLSVALHAALRPGSLSGRSVLVTGGGTIGLLIAIVARAFGATAVVVTDPAAFARRAALDAGADEALDPSSPDFADTAARLSHGGFEVAFEASGSPRALGQAITSVRRGGTIVQVGTLPPDVTLPLNDIMARELALLGSFRFANVFEMALRLMASRRVEVSQLISAVMPLGEMPQAMARAVAKEEVVKIQVEP